MSSLVADSAVLGSRAVTRSLRNPATVMSAIIFPLLFFFLFFVVLERVMESRGFSYRQLLPPTIVIQAMLFSGMSSAYYIADDRQSGVTARFRSLPIHRAAPVIGRSLADLIRAFISMVVVIIAGLVVGMRFERGVAGLLGFVVVALLFALAISLGMGLLGYLAPSAQAASSIASIPYLPLLMLSTGFAPLEDFPGWLQPIVKWQPVTAAIDALRALTGTEELWPPLLRTIIWSVGLSLIFAAMASRALGRTT
ncbi:MAG: ABC transporter permease [Actinomycetota bacterium]